MKEVMNIREAYCVHCGGLFACRRVTAKFCSNACKMDYHRRGSKMAQSGQAAERELSKMLRLVHESRYWHSDETLEMIRGIESRLAVLKARTEAGKRGLHHSAE